MTSSSSSLPWTCSWMDSRASAGKISLWRTRRRLADRGGSACGASSHRHRLRVVGRVGPDNLQDTCRELGRAVQIVSRPPDRNRNPGGPIHWVFRLRQPPDIEPYGLQTSVNLTGLETARRRQAMEASARRYYGILWTRGGSPLEPTTTATTAVDLYRLPPQAPRLAPSAVRPDGTDAALAIWPARCLASSPTPPMNAEASLLRNGKPMK